MLTNEQCDEFRRLPLSFNDMVRAIYEAGRASKAAEYAHIRREARNAALEKAAQLCHELMMSMRYGSPVFDGEDADDFDQGRAAGAEHCRNALRALKDQP
jgi:hypothetical protein